MTDIIKNVVCVPGDDGVSDGDDDMDDDGPKLQHVDGRELKDPIVWKGGQQEHRGPQANLREVLPRLEKNLQPML